MIAAHAIPFPLELPTDDRDSEPLGDFFHWQARRRSCVAVALVRCVCPVHRGGKAQSPCAKSEVDDACHGKVASSSAD